MRLSSPEVTARAFFTLVAIQGAALLTGLVVFDPRELPIVYALTFALASLVWVLLTRAVFAGRFEVSWPHVLVATVGLRLVVQVASPAVLSDDIWRYIWEGRAQLAGYNPFIDSPAELESIGRGDPVWERMNNRAIPAAYPPVGQLFLRLLASFGAESFGTRVAFGLVDVATFFLLSLALTGRGLDRRRALVHGLCPLPIVELCVEGHNDALGIALLVGAVALWANVRRSTWRSVWAGACYGAAIASKYLPLVLVPWLLRAGRVRVIAVATCVVIASFLLFLPPIDRVHEAFEGLGEYGARWRHNDSLFVALRGVTAWGQELLRDAGVTTWVATAHEDRVAKIPLALLFLLGGFWIFRRTRDREMGLETAFVWLLLLLFAITPTLHPWYVCWIVPFLAFAPHAAGFALVTTIAFSYHVLARYHFGDGKWVEQPLWKLVEYVPFYVTLIAVALRSRKTSANVSITVGPSKREE